MGFVAPLQACLGRVWRLALVLGLATTMVACDTEDDNLDFITLALSASALTDNNDGTILQNTGLQWMRCAQGQLRDPALNTCGATGGGTTYGATSMAFCSTLTGNFADCTDANTIAPTATAGPAFTSCSTLTFAGVSGWRTPSQTELVALATAGGSRANFLIFFPQTPDDKYFWTSTGNPSQSDGSEAYAVAFSDVAYGQLNVVNKSAVHYVRCVRTR